MVFQCVILSYFWANSILLVFKIVLFIVVNNTGMNTKVFGGFLDDSQEFNRSLPLNLSDVAPRSFL